jgi:hypothetical protein
VISDIWRWDGRETLPFMPMTAPCASATNPAWHPVHRASFRPVRGRRPSVTKRSLEGASTDCIESRASE